MGYRKVIDHRDFVRDLKRGVEGERRVEKFLKKEFGLLTTNLSDKNPDFDLAVDGVCPDLLKTKKVIPKKLFKKILRDSFGINKRDFITVEVKLDEAADRYGNFFVELFFDFEKATPGNIFKCKADVIAWIVPSKKKGDKVYLFKRPEFLAFLFAYVYENPGLVLKKPRISKYARGLPIPIKELAESYACMGEFDLNV